MLISEALISHLNIELSKYLGERILILDYTKLHGGSVNYSFLLKTNKRPFFIKLNNANAFPKMFELEVKGLKQIENSESLTTPVKVLQGSFGIVSYLVLEFIESGKESLNFWESFGVGLANLHKLKQKDFGLSYSNYIGSLHQLNPLTEEWSAFFGNHRILNQAQIAYDNKRIGLELLRKLESLILKIDTIFPKSTPSLLHGDLWSGNFIVNKESLPVVLDPAIHYGNREMDLSMSLLFGGFNKRFYEAYDEAYPLQEGWEERVDLCNTYPLLVHVNLFGASYAKRLEGMIKRYL